MTMMVTVKLTNNNNYELLEIQWNDADADADIDADTDADAGADDGDNW